MLEKYGVPLYEDQMVEKVLDIIKKPTLGPDTETWIKGIKCGRKAMQEPQDHYEGT